MNGTRRLITTLLVVGATALVAGCASGGESGAKGSATAASTSAAKAGGAAPTGKSVEVEVALKDNVFEPKEIKVKAGDAVTFKVKNEGIAIHNMMVQASATEGKDFSSAPAVNPGEEGKFTATFTKKGTVKFVCAYHLPDMAGTITVE